MSNGKRSHYTALLIGVIVGAAATALVTIAVAVSG